jgi:hypothetical protein
MVLGGFEIVVHLTSRMNETEHSKGYTRQAALLCSFSLIG